MRCGLFATIVDPWRRVCCHRVVVAGDDDVLVRDLDNAKRVGKRQNLADLAYRETVESRLCVAV